MAIIEDIHQELINTPAINAIVGTRVFYNAPVRDQIQDYITFLRNNTLIDQVRDKETFRIIMYATDLQVLETLDTAVRSLFFGTQTLNNVEYFGISILEVVEGRSKLQKEKFWWRFFTVEINFTN